MLALRVSAAERGVGPRDAAVPLHERDVEGKTRAGEGTGDRERGDIQV